MASSNKVTVVLGAQWGAEGKGKVADMLAANADLVCRSQGGNSEIYTVFVDQRKYDFHIISSAVMNPQCKFIIGNGVVVHLPSLFDELKENMVGWRDRFLISDRAHLVFDFHYDVDEYVELEELLFSTGLYVDGIGASYSSKILRNGIQIGDLVGNFATFCEKFTVLVKWHKKKFPDLEVNVEEELNRYKNFAEWIRPLVVETVSYIHSALRAGKNILVEGANAAMLDIDFGTYPHVTSSNCSIGGVCTGLGLPPSTIGEVVGVVKAYTSRLGDGPFPTELANEFGVMLQDRGHELDMITRTMRRCGWLDIPLLQYSSMVNGYTALAINDLDVLDPFREIQICVAYKLGGEKINYFPSDAIELGGVEVEYKSMVGWKSDTSKTRQFSDLPLAAKEYVLLVQDLVGVPVKWVGVGKGRQSMMSVSIS